MTNLPVRMARWSAGHPWRGIAAWFLFVGLLTAVFQGTWAEGLLGFTSTGSIGSRAPLLLRCWTPPSSASWCCPR
ncbi:hypothetical protein [Actinomadura sp. NAK00032]|uniref:hypothetical protein n=1 Tax=Actinomadura sp. NAK00032 TaxID=2742128 RepID=UPI001C378171|nr:hypothetical protein [Actinomadura sp. NAK00032]